MSPIHSKEAVQRGDMLDVADDKGILSGDRVGVLRHWH